MSLAELTDADQQTQWRRRDDVVEVVRDGRLMARVGAGDLLVDDRALRWTSHREHEEIVDAGTNARLAIIRRRAHGPIVVEAGEGRYRITREGLRFWSRIVTRVGDSEQVASARRIGSTVRIDAASTIPAWDLALVQLALVHTWFELGDEAEPAG